MKKSLMQALFHVSFLSIIIFALIFFLKYDKKVEGFVLIVLGILPLLSLKYLGQKIKEVLSEITFGIVNTGLMVVFALAGFELSGILGAVLGVAIGDAITEGFAGIIEGEVIEELRKVKIIEKITPLSASLGKMAGCLFGSGLVLIIAWLVLSL